jgi:hypothetical protein
MDLREIGLGDVDWIRLAQDRDWWLAVVSVVMKLRLLVPRIVIIYNECFPTRLLMTTITPIKL